MKAIKASILSLLTIATFILFAACPTTTEDVDEEVMKEYAIRIDKVFYVEETKELRFEYTIDGYSAYLFEDWEGKTPLSLIHYIVNLPETDFKISRSETSSQLYYLGNTNDLPSSVTCNTTKKVFLFTYEEKTGGIPGVDYGKELTATAKGTITTTSVPLIVMRSTSALLTPLASAAIPSYIQTYEPLIFGDDSMLLFKGLYTADPFRAHAYMIASHIWKKIIPDNFDFAGACATTLCYIKNDQLFTSDDNGASWTSASVPVPPRPDHNPGLGAFVGENIALFYKGDPSVLLVSSDKGLSWTVHELPFSSVKNIVIHGNSIYIEDYSTIKKSNDFGFTWVTDTELSGSLLSSGTILYLDTKDGLFRLTNEEWVPFILPSDESYPSFHASAEDFIYTNAYRTGFGLYIVSAGKGAWYFLSKDPEDCSYIRILGNTIAFIYKDRIDMYRINR
ncbi:MAG: hypothetical protein JW875_04055 [Spirochaetales bacterium]|nr:hypothetical protein [Spirochaetales bacterium]